MVSQRSTEEWPSPRTEATDCTQRQPLGGRNPPPSYLDAVRSRHSLSQPTDSSKLLRTISSQMQYNSLPRPLPQRLQGTGQLNGFHPSREGEVPSCDVNGQEDERYQPPLRSRGFQVYSRPPGPANHVPLMGSARLSNTLPRTLPSSRNGREFQKPLSVMVSPGEFHDAPSKQQLQRADRAIPGPITRQASNGGSAPSQFFNGTAPRGSTTYMERKPAGRQDLKSYPSNEQMNNNSLSLAQFYQQSRFSAYRANNPHYPKWGTLPSRRPSRVSVPEPAVSLRTGPLGSYPDFERTSTENRSPGISPKSVNIQTNGSLLEIDRKFAEPRPSQPADHAALYSNQSKEEHAFRRVNDKSATLPTRKSGHLMHPLDNFSRDFRHPEQTRISSQHEDLVVRNNNRDYYHASPQEDNPCHTPEDVGLVMIVEARDLNIKSKDVLKPTARMPTSQDRFVAENFPNNYSNAQHFTNSDSMHGYGSGATDSPKEQHLPYHHPTHISSNGTSLGAGSSQIAARSFGEHALRRTPLSSSTASLSSERSSVSSRHKHSETASERLRSTSKNGQSNRSMIFNAAPKKSNISPSPWLREEKEQLQKQHIRGMRRARDEEIARLEKIPERSPEQEERLRLWLLEREFQRRAEELGDDDDEEEEEESLLERADLRERTLAMERSRESAMVDERHVARCSSSSDLWLRNSQAKHQPKPGNSESSQLNGSFEVQQFNDLLETMNMSPVIRDDASEADSRASTSDVATDETAINQVRANKTTAMPLLAISSSNMKALPAPCLEFCHSLNQKNFTSISSENEVDLPSIQSCHSSAFNPIITSPQRCNNYLPEEFIFNNNNNKQKLDLYASDSGLNGKSSIHGAFSTASSFNRISDVKRKVLTESDVKERTGKVATPESDCGTRSFSTATAAKEPTIKSRAPAPSKSLHELRSSDANLVAGVVGRCGKVLQQAGDDFGSRRANCKKASIPKPESLPFHDKIRIFSMKAGEESLPKDRVKNSRAQRELEVKFNSDTKKPI